ncbi:MAG: hypothetical protein ACLFTK_15995 [Anaerolineales bacterium]
MTTPQDDQRPERPEEVEQIAAELGQVAAGLDESKQQELKEQTDAITRVPRRYESSLPQYTYEGSNLPNWEGDVIPTKSNTGPKTGQTLFLCGVVGIVSLVVLVVLCGCLFLVVGALGAESESTGAAMDDTGPGSTFRITTATPRAETAPPRADIVIASVTPPLTRTLLPPTWTPTVELEKETAGD